MLPAVVLINQGCTMVLDRADYHVGATAPRLDKLHPVVIESDSMFDWTQLSFTADPTVAGVLVTS